MRDKDPSEYYDPSSMNFLIENEDIVEREIRNYLNSKP